MHGRLSDDGPIQQPTSLWAELLTKPLNKLVTDFIVLMDFYGSTWIVSTCSALYFYYLLCWKFQTGIYN